MIEKHSPGLLRKNPAAWDFTLWGLQLQSRRLISMFINAGWKKAATQRWGGWQLSAPADAAQIHI
jgi:hypothetical protein